MSSRASSSTKGVIGKGIATCKSVESRDRCRQRSNSSTKKVSDPAKGCTLKPKLLLILDEDDDSKLGLNEIKSPSGGTEVNPHPSTDIIDISDTEDDEIVCKTENEDVTDDCNDNNNALSGSDDDSDNFLNPEDHQLCYVAPNLILSRSERDMVDDIIATTDLSYPLYVFEAVPGKASSGLFFSKDYSDNIPKPVAPVVMKLVGSKKYVKGKLTNCYSNGRACITTGWKTFCITNKMRKPGVHVLKMHWSKKRQGVLKVHLLALSK
ncbi:hypothetical protein ACP70R_017623 [Stipagrostis hirtigluma subsp. patula]